MWVMKVPVVRRASGSNRLLEHIGMGSYQDVTNRQALSLMKIITIIIKYHERPTRESAHSSKQAIEPMDEQSSFSDDGMSYNQREYLAYELDSELAGLSDLDQILEQTINHLVVVLGYYYAHIYLYDGNDSLTMAYGYGEIGHFMKEAGHKIPLSAMPSLVARAARDRVPIIVGNVEAIPEHLPNPLLPDTRAEIAVPLYFGKRLLGVLDAQHDGYDAFSAVEVRILEIVADLLTEALSDAEAMNTEGATTEQSSSIPHAVNDRSSEDDQLGFTDYAAAFAHLIMNPEVEPPLTIGIYGTWGTGKTFLLNEIKKHIAMQWKQRVNPTRKNKKLRPLIVHFNAWTYNGSDMLWAGLVEQLFRAIERRMGRVGKQLFTVRRNFRKQRRVIANKGLLYVSFIIAVVVSFILILQNLALQQIVKIVTVLSITVIFALWREFAPILGTLQSSQIAKLFDREHYDEERGLMARIREDVEAMTEALNGTRMVVFIDDLDRCKPERAIEVLEAIHLLLDEGVFFVFLAIDVRVITSFIEGAYGKNFGRAGISGYKYLDKIVQIPFSIPPARTEQMRNYLNSLIDAKNEMTSTLSDWKHYDIEETVSPPPFVRTRPESSRFRDREREDPSFKPTDKLLKTRQQLEEVSFTLLEGKTLRTLQRYLDPNPRHIKRLVNIYRLVRTLALNRGMSSNRIHPKKVLSWLVLTQQWPQIMSELLIELEHCRDQVQNLTELYNWSMRKRTLEDLHRASDHDVSKFSELIRYCHFINIRDIGRLQQLTGLFDPAIAPEETLKTTEP
jgi:putative methionine-R-sulfoxide reductase with GAF domain